MYIRYYYYTTLACYIRYVTLFSFNTLEIYLRETKQIILFIFFSTLTFVLSAVCNVNKYGIIRLYAAGAKHLNTGVRYFLQFMINLRRNVRINMAAIIDVQVYQNWAFSLSHFLSLDPSLNRICVCMCVFPSFVKKRKLEWNVTS